MTTILVVEDEEPVQQLVADLLEEEGYRVLVAGDGAQALALMQSDPPDLVISDLMMPVMSGVELCRRLRSDAQTRALPILVMSAAGRGMATDCEANAFLSKPFDLDALLALVIEYAGPA
jgi:CheY-like chemotaxis protein